MTKKQASPGFPCLVHEPEDQTTRPVPLQEWPRQARIDHELAIVRQHHERITKAVEAFWGREECAEYLNRLILSGGDGFGKIRVGFRQEVLSALLNLLSLHEAGEN